MRGIQGKITVVTGGTRGIGKGIAKRFLEEGATVIIIGGKNGRCGQGHCRTEPPGPD